MGGDEIGKDGDKDHPNEKKQAKDGTAIFTEIGPEFAEDSPESGWAIIDCFNNINEVLHGCFGHD